MKGKNGFTLIELLVVIGIVTLLAAILFPVFASARQKAGQATCSSNERQLGIAIMHYVQDNDESFPIAGSYMGGGPVGWAGRTYPYVGSRGVFSCPDDVSDPTSAPNTDKLSYAFNVNLRGVGTVAGQVGWPVGANPIGGTLPKLSQPSKTVLLIEVTGMGLFGHNSGVNLLDTSVGGGDENSFFVNGGDDGGPGWIPTGQWQYNTGILGNPARPVSDDYYLNFGVHNGGSNFLYVDGHVKWLLPGSVSSGGPASSSGCGQDLCPTTGWSGNAASTDMPNFQATFSPV